MSQVIPSNQFSHGAGKGDDERPVDRKRYARNFEQIRWMGKISGKIQRVKNGKTTIVYR